VEELKEAVLDLNGLHAAIYKQQEAIMLLNEAILDLKNTVILLQTHTTIKCGECDV